MARAVKVEVPPATSAARRGQRASGDQVPPSSSVTVVEDDVTMTEAQNQQRSSVSRALSSQNLNGIPDAHVDDSSDTVDPDSDAGLELLGQGMKAFVTLIQDLRDLGVEELVLPLPKICVLGDQSTGKSSLIEGISGIKVPRERGTCTRCPLEINLTTSEPSSTWRCTIYLQKHYIYEGSQLSYSFGRHGASRGEGATRTRPLGPWIAQNLPDSTLFYKTTKKADILRALQRAQLATLNPGMDPRRFHPDEAEPEKGIQVKFSPNVVRVDISAPDVPNLSFYDLPGVINQAEVLEEEYLVKLVANLVKNYIKNDTCINLLAMPMTDDAANSTASKLVQELKAQHRTIGVLTKPDLLQGEESLSQWIDILEGRKFKLGHGYFVVRNNKDPRVSNSIAREEEEQFFRSQEPWAQALFAHQGRFGTLKLQGVLSKRLTAQIRTSLPQITERVRMKTAEVIARLNELPQPPRGNLSLKILEKILAFEHDLHKHIDGGSEHHPFLKEWHAAAFNFRDTIASSYPRLSLSDSLTTAQSFSRLAYRLSATPTPIARRSEVIAVESDEEGDATQPFTPTPSSKRKQTNSKSSQSSPPKRPRISEIPQHVPSQDGNASSVDSSHSGRSAPFAKRFTLTEIRNILHDAHIGLPNQTDPRATKRMIKESLTGWDKPLKEFLRFTEQHTRAMILERAANAFGMWRGTRMFEVVEETCTSFFEEKINNQIIHAERVLTIERQQALTLHKDTMSAASDKAFALVDEACRKERARAFLNKNEPGWDDKLKDQAKTDKISKMTDDQLGPNPYKHELCAISVGPTIPKFVDVIYQGIQAELFTACRNELGTVLKERIGLEEKDAEQRCTVLLAVDPESERIRIELTKQKENLEKACVWLDSQ
ncbi:MAG: hypothetical protein LQ338_007577 [Usnochroma carphineum]|nr:MAG: hypothetical protein LQ338_007577 [Usnochroma carphineum]